MRGLFIAGTDTNVGKTVVSAALMIAFGEQENVRYWKPIQTGIETDCDTTTVQELTRLEPGVFYTQGYRLKQPLSPHLSARFENTRIDLTFTLKMVGYRKNDFFWVVEGAGGVLVPLNEEHMMLDLMKRLGLPVLVVARPTLGTINHTLLTIEALKNRYLNVAGVVFNGGHNTENQSAIEHHSGVPVIASLPKFRNPMSEKLHNWVRENHSCFDRL